MLLCSIHTGPGKDIYTVGAAGDKGSDGSEEKLYCQVTNTCISAILTIALATYMYSHYAVPENLCCLLLFVVVYCRLLLRRSRLCLLMTPLQCLGSKRMKTMLSLVMATTLEHPGL